MKNYPGGSIGELVHTTKKECTSEQCWCSCVMCPKLDTNKKINFKESAGKITYKIRSLQSPKEYWQGYELAFKNLAKKSH
jgi:hypothetical protein